MRFVLAIVSFLLAALAIGAGIAQKTVFAAPDREVQSISLDSTAPITVIDGTTLNAFPRSQTVQLAGSTTAFAAYGRTTDVMGWIGDASYNTVSFSAGKGLVSTTTEAAESIVPSPAGSDLWLEEFPAEKASKFTVNVPKDISLIIVSDGTQPAPADITLSWRLDNDTPWATPLVAAGGGLLLLGLVLLLWAITHLRRARGPRRKQPKMPKLPRQPRYKPSKQTRQRALPATRGRRSTRTGMIAVPFVLVTALSLGACSFAPTPEAQSPSPTPTPGADTTQVAEPQQPAVTAAQATRIIARVSAVAAKSDKANNAKTLAARFAGPALQRRIAAYKIHKVDKTIDPVTAVPSGPVALTLPGQNDSWPRTVFAVIKGADETVPPLAVTMIQDDARSQYKVHYSVALEPGIETPKVAKPSIGAPRLPVDVKLLTLAPESISKAYGDILVKGKKSKYYPMFEANGDSLRVEVGVEAKKQRVKKLPKTAKLTFANAPGTGQVVALATIDAGAIVAVQLTETETVKPVQTGAAVSAPKDVKALLGKSLSTKGLRAVYADQLLFYVPSATVGGKIQLLGYSQGLVGASELKKAKK